MQRKTVQAIVTYIVEETAVVKRFTLKAVDQTNLPPYSGGSHIMTILPNGLERHYSVFNTTAETGIYEIAVRLADDSMGGSLYWHYNVKIGDVVHISYPKNHFTVSFQAKHHVFYAAGIGITPFLSMMEELTEKCGSFEIHYAAKSKEQCAFYEYLNDRYPNQCHFYFSQDENRLSTVNLANHRIGTHVYFCGPDSMIQDFSNAAKNYGYPSFNVHFERFSPPQIKDKKAFQVILQKSGKQLTVSENDSLLDVFLQNDIDVNYSCRVGGCGTCEVKVVEGEVVHFDSFLTEEQQCANDKILACVSRGNGNLVLNM